MDENQKNQNQPPATPGNTIQPSQQPSTQPPPPPQPAAAQPPQGFSSQQAYDQYDPNAAPRTYPKKVIVFIAVFALLVIPGAGGAYFLLGDKNKNETKQASETPQGAQQQSSTDQKIEVPADWQPLDTTLAFMVKVPAGWTASETIEAPANEFKLTAKGMAITSSDSQELLLGTQALDNSTSQADFDQALKDMFEQETALTSLAGQENQHKTTFSEVTINGEKWVRIDRVSEAPGKFSVTLYKWVNDHAIFTSISNDNKESLDKLVTDYLYPMTASVELK